MSFCTDDGESTEFCDAGSQFDVGSAPSHVGGDGYGAFLSCACDDFGFFLVVFGVEYVVWDTFSFEHAAEEFGDFYGGGSDEYGSSLFVESFNFGDDGVVFFAFGFEDEVFFVFADTGFVCRDDDDVQFVDFPEFCGFGFGGSGHSSQFVVHPEVVLECDGGVGLCIGFYFDVFFGFYGLVESF